jgi:hypothetical protein
MAAPTGPGLVRAQGLVWAMSVLDRVFGAGHAAAHLDEGVDVCRVATAAVDFAGLFFADVGICRIVAEPVSAVTISAALDWAAMTIAAALAVEDEETPANGPVLVRAHGLVRP